MRYSSATLLVRPVAGLIAVAVLAVGMPTFAQQYQSDPIESRLANQGVMAQRYAKSGQGDAQEFKDYMEKVFFPTMTQTTPEALAGLQKQQDLLFKQYLTGTAATQKYVHDQAMAFSQRVVAGRYHPSVRYNALLILGKLNDKYPTGGEDPVPAAKATDLLCMLTDSAISNPRTPNYLLVGALLGLERHAAYSAQLPGAQKKKLMVTLNKVLTMDKLEGDFTPEVRDWVYTRAASAVASTKNPGFINGLAKRVADDTLSLETRAALLAELSKLNAQPGKDYGPVIAKAAIELASDIGKEEAEVAGKFDDMQLQSGAGFIGARGKLSRRVTMSLEGGPKLYREGILLLFNDLKEGVAAAEKISPDDQKPTLTAINAAVTNVVNKTADKGAIDLDVTEAIKQMAAAVADATTQPLAKTE